ncbi:MAG: cupin domain-containing protein [Candidatus Nanopelagicales bacterium]
MKKLESGRATNRFFTLIFLFGLLLSVGCASAEVGEITSQTLLDKTGVTVLDEDFKYPQTDKPEITSSIITVPAGAETGWHLHEAPMYAYILEGTISLTYLVDGTEVLKEYKKGEAIMEGLDTPHNGVNKTNSEVRILVVNIGSSDLLNTVKIN